MYQDNKETSREENLENHEEQAEEPAILEDIHVEELAIDGICGVY